MMKLQKFIRDLRLLLITLLDMKSYELSCIHVEWNNSILNFVLPLILFLSTASSATVALSSISSIGALVSSIAIHQPFPFTEAFVPVSLCFTLNMGTHDAKGVAPTTVTVSFRTVSAVSTVAAYTFPAFIFDIETFFLSK